MRIVKEPIDLEWTSLLESELPAAVLYGAVLTIVHTASFVPWDSVRQRLKDALSSAPKERRTLRGVELRWEHGNIPLEVRLTRRRIRLRALQSLPSSRFKRILHALADLPNTGRVRLQGRVQRFRDDVAGGPRAPRPPRRVRRPHWMNTARRFDADA